MTPGKGPEIKRSVLVHDHEAGNVRWRLVVEKVEKVEIVGHMLRW